MNFGWKRISVQEWMILLLFILSIVMLIAVVEWSHTPEETGGYADAVKQEEPSDILSYNWAVNFEEKVKE
ncbi:hypothetical protein [Salibacterium halotolerans]|uniref:Uncharacterized protein n=1 Tax=Salibacterium halotolerans TaxID=1884432 RepID=A0A1I5UXK1_9BACI|nr:hypothetical protein [Salibacterium halotolerans]SFP99938.1 hypothetical protein SAMN05518683_11494 [Salibacterium halotolerans]